MARERKIPVSAINIALHEPHSAAHYVDLIRSLYNLRRIVVLRGTTGALIGSLYPIDKDRPENGLVGELYQFIHLDTNEPWFDVENLEEATEQDVANIKIPEKLKPHLARFNFAFFPKGHRLYVQTRNKNRTFSINAAHKLTKTLLAAPRFLKYNGVEVTVEPERDSLSRVLKIDYLKKLEIVLVRPNPDDHQAAERRVLEKLSRQDARRQDTVLYAAANQDLEPDADTKLLAKVASSNGMVTGYGFDSAGNAITKSTTEKPWVETAKFDPDVQTEFDAFLQKSAEMHKAANR